ncbi:tyrosine-protein kinase Src64B-like [Neocloeon triangulifer]|uniref:tyrosine-protein kinase Src64B-like n=1 Tax=Neocloeon triangulifer TaxID=2078957 RepID=UPI00286F4B69|nr:tyrosine-protein kinase Src64B-like [Neocloeon triangulifer]
MGGCYSRYREQHRPSSLFLDDGPVRRGSNNIYQTLRPFGSKPNYNILSNPPVQAGQKVVIGIHNFHAEEKGDISFNRNDRMVVVDESDPGWLKVHHMANGRTGYIPANYVIRESKRPIENEEWFFYKIPRKQAKELLLKKGNPRGTFLIRVSDSNPNGYVLSVLDKVDKEYHVKHYKIKTTTDQSLYYISLKYEFLDVRGIVKAYSDSKSGLCCKLTQPCPREMVDFLSLYRRDQLETDPNQLCLTKVGKVWLGSNKNQQVTVKKLGSPEAFSEEAEMMKMFCHKNLVAMYAVCSNDEPMYFIQEFTKNGSPLDGENQNGLIHISLQIASELLGKNNPDPRIY